jgi:hypothetical protein
LGDYGAETFNEFVLYNYSWSAHVHGNIHKRLSKFTIILITGIDDERLSNIYETLSNPLNQIIWHEVWRHPLLKFKEPVWWEPRISKAGRISWNEFSLPQVKADIDELKSKVKKNSDHFELIEFILKLNDWYKLKIETQILIQNTLREKSIDNENEIVNLIDQNIRALNSLKQSYRILWLKYYKIKFEYDRR